MLEFNNFSIRIATLSALHTSWTSMSYSAKINHNNQYWHLLTNILKQDPSEKVRLVAIDKIVSAGHHLQLEESKDEPALFRFIPEFTIIELCLKRADISLKVQERASTFLLFGFEEVNGDKKQNYSILSSTRPAIVCILENSSEAMKYNCTLILLVVFEAVCDNPTAFCSSMRWSIETMLPWLMLPEPPF